MIHFFKPLVAQKRAKNIKSKSELELSERNIIVQTVNAKANTQTTSYELRVVNRLDITMLNRSGLNKS